MATILIAAYAAVVATVGVGWQIYSFRHARRNRATIQIRNAVIPLPPGSEWVLSITVMNGNDHAVRVNGYGLETNDGSGNDFVFFRNLPGSNLPGIIEAHDSGTALQNLDELTTRTELDFTHPLVAFASLATGDRIRSTPTKIATH